MGQSGVFITHIIISLVVFYCPVHSTQDLY